MRAGAGAMTTNEREQLLTLAAKVRVADLAQLSREFHPQSASGRIRCKRWAQEQERRGLVSVFQIVGKPVRDVELVHRGKVGASHPDFAELSRESCRRWGRIAPEPLTVITATPKLRNIFGGSPRIRFRSMAQIPHDLAVAAVCLKLRREDPRAFEYWLPEDDLKDPAYREAQPDAAIVRDHIVERVIEFASGYQAEKFAKLDRTFRSRGISYEVYMPR